MRGRWLVEKQLINRPHTKHRFDLLYDEFSPDTLLNQVFRFAVDTLLFQTRDPGNRRLLTDLRDWLTPVLTISQISSTELDRVVFTRLIERYRPAFNLARMFIEHTTPIFTPGKTMAFAFVFDMNYLFEKFIARFIERHRRNIFPGRWDQMQIRVQSEGKSIHLARRKDDNKSVFHLIPDITLETSWGLTLLVLDTKYKQLNAEQRFLGVSEGDIYQMLAYLVRLECPQGLILYPQAADVYDHRQRFDFEKQGGQVMVATVNLRRPIHQTQVFIQEFRELFTQILAVST
jgi:5-methylcytosine-specific restriction enzyme subunit McrC